MFKFYINSDQENDCTKCAANYDGPYSDDDDSDKGKCLPSCGDNEYRNSAHICNSNNNIFMIYDIYIYIFIAFCTYN